MNRLIGIASLVLALSTATGALDEVHGQVVLDLDPATGNQGVLERTVKPGEVVEVEVLATGGAAGIIGFEIEVAFDSRQVIFKGFQAGGMMSGALSMPPQVTPESVLVSTAIMGGRKLTDDAGSLGKFRFEAARNLGGSAEIRVVGGSFGSGQGTKKFESDSHVRLINADAPPMDDAAPTVVRDSFGRRISSRAERDAHQATVRARNKAEIKAGQSETGEQPSGQGFRPPPGRGKSGQGQHPQGRGQSGRGSQDRPERPGSEHPQGQPHDGPHEGADAPPMDDERGSQNPPGGQPSGQGHPGQGFQPPPEQGQPGQGQSGQGLRRALGRSKSGQGQRPQGRGQSGRGSQNGPGRPGSEHPQGQPHDGPHEGPDPEMIIQELPAELQDTFKSTLKTEEESRRAHRQVELTTLKSVRRTLEATKTYLARATDDEKARIGKVLGFFHDRDQDGPPRRGHRPEGPGRDGGMGGMPPGDPGSANVEQMVRRMIQEVDEEIRHLEQER
jgi:hypothetical protein